MDITVSELGEQGLLAQLQSYCPAGVVGDDAALITLVPGQSLVVTTDVLVEGVHFSDRTTPPHAVGWRAAAANLSDLAAMGATGIGITVGLTLPPDCPVAWVTEVYRGLQDCLKVYDLAILGGDLSRNAGPSAGRSLAITALGQVAHHQAILRHSAQPGDAILVTGSHGGARAGLEILLQPLAGKLVSSEGRSQLIQKHQYPQARLDCIPLLKSHGRISGMDSSDGLADAIVQLARASGVGAIVQADQIPLVAALKTWQPPAQVLDWALYGGEDFELVLCLPPEQARLLCRHLCAQLGNDAAIVGSIIAEPGVYLEFGSSERVGDRHRIPLSLEAGFQHFSRRRDHPPQRA
ncbi:MAG: thiamine-phosphate kinase [Synechococcales cyanobacterium RU_4_20]|nr:thiamine-phosphate kinase [Synechococcales cyanobacterium RU_4_20]NJR69981.1 thiamine-phosphate kinase [Synechococcales cyanobacterium CRU_2_2]